jgi:hypothetical protein
MPYLGSYTGAPSTQPQSSDTPFLRDSATPSAFGVNVDEANQQLGRSISGLGDEFTKIANQQQDDYLTAAASQTQNNFSLSIAERSAQHQQLTGAAAVADAAPYQQFLQDMKAKALAEAPNGAVARLVGPRLDSIATGYTISSFNHVAAQTKQYAIEQTEARATISANQGALADTDAQFDEALNNNRGAIEDKGRQKGWSPEKLQEEVLKGQAVVRAGQLAKLGSMGQADRAMMLYNQWSKEGKMFDPSGTVYDQVEKAQIKEGAIRFANDQLSGSYNSNLRKTENPNGSFSTKNPDSSAAGLFQVTKDTWDTTAKAHPELGLTPGGRTGEGVLPQETVRQQTAEQNARAADQEAILKDKGFPVNQKNKYIMHLMGSTGGPNFLETLRDEPDAKAAEEFPAAAAVNRPYFYNPDGSAKTMKEAYAAATRNFGAGQLSASSTIADVTKMEAAARDEAEARFPGDAAAAETYKTAVRGKYNDQLYDFNQAKNENLNVMKNIAFADPINPPKLEDVMNNPQFIAAADNIRKTPGGDALVGGILKSVANAKNIVPMTPEREQLLDDMDGLRKGQPQAFLKINPWDLNLPYSQQAAIHKEQIKMKDVSEGDPQLGAAIKQLEDSGTLQSVGLFKPKANETNPRWTSFLSRLNGMMKTYMLQHPGQVPGEKEIKDMAGGLFTPSKGWITQKAIFGPEFQYDMNNVPKESVDGVPGSDEIKSDLIKRVGEAGYSRLLSSEPDLIGIIHATRKYERRNAVTP